MKRFLCVPISRWRCLFLRFIAPAYLVFFCLCWLIKLDVLPGLHGDEAWFGLAAANAADNTAELLPMNSYTGIFQSLVSVWLFKLFGLGVLQLRIPGFIFNILGIFIVLWISREKDFKKPALITVAILAQSALFLTSPRIAWEVNTFTFFLVAILAVCHLKFYRNQEASPRLWIIIFWATNMIGCYNHFIFSCLSLASLTGILLWTLAYKDIRFKNLLSLSLVNMLNLTVLFLLMHFCNRSLIASHLIETVLCMLIVLYLEHRFLLKFLSKIKAPKYLPLANQIPVLILFAIGAAFFVYFHGRASFYVLTNYMVLLHTYSYPTAKLLIFIECGCGVVLISYFFFLIIKDLKIKEQSLFAFMVLSYMGLFPLYTTESSFRYYLAILFVFSVYMSLRLTLSSKLWMLALGLSFVINTCSVVEVFFDNNRQVKAISFHTGSDEKETSAHFLINQPLLDFLKANKIGHMELSDKDRYFLDLPIQFYYKVKPWKTEPSNSAIVDYDYINPGTGYILLKNGNRDTSNYASPDK